MRLKDRKLFFDKQKKAIEDLYLFMENLGIKKPELGISIGPGWVEPVKKCLNDLCSAGWNKNVFQIKQKFCGLRFYFDNEDKELFNYIVTKAEVECGRLCEMCGEQREQKDNYFGFALCNNCGED